ncbi:hypothetical protein QNE90_004851 [Vibrio alginolyticus]|nr:hypothetical protein [Vibrio alginolyticus]
MNKLIILILFFSFSVASNNENEVSMTPLIPPELTSSKWSESEYLNPICKSVVCKSPSKEQTIPYLGDVPPREGNSTLNAVSGIIYIFLSGDNEG